MSTLSFPSTIRSKPQNRTRLLLWFWRDLRIHDQILLSYAAENGAEVLGLIFEPKGKTDRQKEFYLESAYQLKRFFQKNNLPLFVLQGEPKIEIPRWMEINSIETLLVQDSFNSRDQKLISDVEIAVSPRRVKKFFNQTMVDLQDLPWFDQTGERNRKSLQKDAARLETHAASSNAPFELKNFPLVFTQFRRVIEADVVIKSPVIFEMKNISGILPRVPEQTQVSVELTSAARKIQFPFEIMPGEVAGLERVQEYFWHSKSLSHYKETRNGMLLKNDSSKFSVWLANGSLSPRWLYQEIQDYHRSVGRNESTDWFVMELLWRDYFKFLSFFIGEKLFSIQGISRKEKTWNREEKLFSQWCKGETGVDFVDAHMIELNETGWMSNRGRQNVASYLAKSLNIDWTWGAKYFEDHLIDDDPESNWGNWLYVAGVGTDPRDRVFNVERQAEMYDPHFEYRHRWLPKTRIPKSSL